MVPMSYKPIAYLTFAVALIAHAQGVGFVVASAAPGAPCALVTETGPEGRSGAAAEQPAIHRFSRDDVVVVKLDERAFAELCDAMSLDEDQRREAASYYSVYCNVVDRIADGILSDLHEGGLDDITGGAVEDMEDPVANAEARVQRSLVIGRGQETIEQARALLLDSVVATLRDDQRGAAIRAIRSWRRTEMLKPHTGLVHYTGDLKGHVDLPELARQAMRPGQELEHLLNLATRVGMPAAEQVAIQWHEMMEEYEHRLDSILKNQFYDRWRDYRLLVAASIRGDQDAVLRFHERLASFWRQVYDATTSAAEDFGGVAGTALGPDARRAWLQRFYRAYYPITDHEVSTDVLHQRLMSDLALDADQLRAVNAIYQAYDERQAPLRARSREISLRMKMEESPFLGNWNPFEPPEQKQRIERQRADLAAATNQQFRSLLNPDQRAQFEVLVAVINSDVGHVRWQRY